MCVNVHALIISIHMYFLCLCLWAVRPYQCGADTMPIAAYLVTSCIPSVRCAAWLPSGIMGENSKV